MIDDLVERNQKLEDENDKLSNELRVLQLKFADSSPASNHSESTDEGNFPLVAGTVGANRHPAN